MPQLVFDDEVATSIPAVHPVAPVWKERTVVFRRPAGNILYMDGWQYGPLVVHATWDDPTKRSYVVTHLHTLLVVCRCDTTDKAVAAAEWLWQRCGVVLSAWEPDVGKLPADVVQWCRSNQ